MSRIRANLNRGFAAGLISFALLMLFTVSAVILLVLGLSGYRGVVRAGETAAELRTTLGYVSSKLHAAGETDRIYIDHREGTDVLIIAEDFEDDALETRIYWYDGALNEIYTYAETPFEPEYGTRLADIAEFKMSGFGSIYSFEAETDSGLRQALTVNLHRETEAAQ